MGEEGWNRLEGGTGREWGLDLGGGKGNSERRGKIEGRGRVFRERLGKVKRMAGITRGSSRGREKRIYLDMLFWGSRKE